MPEDWNVSSAFKSLVALRMSFWSLFVLYLYLRKKHLFLLIFSLALFACTAVIITLPNVPYYATVLLMIGVLILAIGVSFREINQLDKSGKKAREILSLDKIDGVAFLVFFVGWLFLRKSVLP